MIENNRGTLVDKRVTYSRRSHHMSFVRLQLVLQVIIEGSKHALVAKPSRCLD
jgi:hypothetical protein